ncbi:GDSL-type esterase/lipase family protein, partial [Variovorax paradoxus]|uniref:SGNH/GDSL hydrolase family protein n=2 Tax=Comamonadaceae TaxID=80864 RepID=UPI000A439F9B
PPLVAATPAERAGCSVTLEGDSILYGGFVPGPRLPETPAALLHRLRPAYTVVDNSVPALTAALRARPFAAERRSTRFVVLQHGINDAQNATALAPPLRRMVERVQAEGRVPVVTGLARQFGARKVRRRDAYDATAREVARSRGALFADWGAVEGRPEDMADWIHPGTPYSARLVERLVAVLDAAAPECAQGPLARADRILPEPSP